MKLKSESEVTQSYLTLRDPMDCSPPGSSVHGIFQARALEWVPLPSPLTALVFGKRSLLQFLSHQFSAGRERDMSSIWRVHFTDGNNSGLYIKAENNFSPIHQHYNVEEIRLIHANEV